MAGGVTARAAASMNTVSLSDLFSGCSGWGPSGCETLRDGRYRRLLLGQCIRYHEAEVIFTAAVMPRPIKQTSASQNVLIIQSLLLPGSSTGATIARALNLVTMYPAAGFPARYWRERIRSNQYSLSAEATPIFALHVCPF
jgi:hypothetical protein